MAMEPAQGHVSVVCRLVQNGYLGRIFVTFYHTRTFGVVIEIGNDEFHIVSPPAQHFTQEDEPSCQESVERCMEICDEYNLHTL